MKKVFLFLMACFLSLTMSARVAYLVPVAQRVDMGCQECDLPYEACDNGEQSPERRAFKWFRDDYTGEKTVLYLNDLANIPADVNAIWIHVDRVGFNTAAFDAVFTSEVKENLKAFVNRGGNVFLAKQATRLEYDLVNAKHFSDDNRAELDYSDGGYIGAQTWGASILFYATNNDDDNNNHRVWGSYANHAMFKNAPHRSDSYLEYVWSDGKQITDHNSGFPIGQMNMNGTDWRLELWGFQQKNNCRVIGGWANGDGCHYGGIVEFYPTASRKGTVVMLGLAAYQWINNNAGNGFDNVKKSTEDLLKYLDNKAVKGRNQDKLMTDIFAEDWCYPASLETENHTFRIVHPNIDGWTMSSWIPEDQRSIADIRYIERSAEDKHDRIEFYQEGTVDLHIKLTEDREFQAWPKGDYEFVRKVKFTYSSSAQAVADADLSSNGLDPVNSGKFMVLHGNMQGLEALDYAISFDGIEEANRAEVRKVYDSEFTRLIFDKAGTVKLNIRLNEPNYREEWAKGEHNVTKTVTFDQPAFSWSHTPDIASIGEDKDPVAATCTNVPGVTTVKFESDNTEIATIDENTGKITYIKQGSCNVYAYVTISGVKFRSEAQVVTVNGLNILWDNEPKASVFVSDQPTVAAHIEYGAGTIQYECTNCLYSEGHLTFTAAGTATIRPYVTTGGETYYGEQTTITVVDPATTNPSAATAFLLLEGVSTLPESERNCAEWFLNGNVKSGAGRYLDVTDLSNIPATVKTIIIHADRESVYNFSGCAEALKTWVKAGGNLVLMRQATILAYQMNRIDYAPHNEALKMEDNPKKEGMEGRTETDFTSINVCMGTRSVEPALQANSKGQVVVDRSGDDFFNGMTITEQLDGQKLITLNTAERRASNCCFWQEMYYQNPGSGNPADYATESRAKFDIFESKYNCQVLAVEAGILDFCLPAIIRFKSGMYNGAQWKGSIMAIGAGGFQFNNENQANFEVLGQVAESAKEHVAGGSACNNCFTITIR